jgi:hypothetical protein
MGNPMASAGAYHASRVSLCGCGQFITLAIEAGPLGSQPGE